MLLSPGVKAVGPPPPTPPKFPARLSLPPHNCVVIWLLVRFFWPFLSFGCWYSAQCLSSETYSNIFQATWEKTNKVTLPFLNPWWGAKLLGKQKQRCCSTTSSQLMLASSQADSTNKLMVCLVHLQTIELDFTMFQQHNQDVVVALARVLPFFNIFAILSGNTSTRPLPKWLNYSQQ